MAIDVFRQLKEAVVAKELPVRVCWEFRDSQHFNIEYEERASASRFRVEGHPGSSVGELLKLVETQAFTFRRRHKQEPNG